MEEYVIPKKVTEIKLKEHEEMIGKLLKVEKEKHKTLVYMFIASSSIPESNVVSVRMDSKFAMELEDKVGKVVGILYLPTEKKGNHHIRVVEGE